MSALRTCHGDYHFVSGVGMDGVIETVIRTLVDPGEQVAISTPTFSFYSLAAMGQGAEVTCVPREPDFSVNAEHLIRAGGKAKIVVVCSPNNPTGNVTSVELVAESCSKESKGSFSLIMHMSSSPGMTISP